MNKLGSQIRQLRKLKGFTMEELGEKAGICCKYVGEIERGVKNPTVTVLQKIAMALEVHTGFLLSSSEIANQHFTFLASINGILYSRDIETLTKIDTILKMIFAKS